MPCEGVVHLLMDVGLCRVMDGDEADVCCVHAWRAGLV